jgi:hypothetical protein
MLTYGGQLGRQLGSLVIGSVLGLVPTHRLSGQNITHSITNGLVFVGIDSDWGGAIVAYTYQGRPNWIDNGIPDPGRSVQVALYRGGEVYQCYPCTVGCAWGWNPVQAGSCSTGSGFISVDANESRIVVTTQPLQWNPGPGRSNVLVTTRISIVHDRAVRVDHQVTNNETFTVSGAAQEWPVAYLISGLGRAFRYQGASPGTLDPPEEVAVPVGPNQLPPFQTTEPWIAWAGVDAVGLGLHVPFELNYEWRFQRLQPQGTTSTNALQRWLYRDLAPGETSSFSVYLIAGSITEIRLETPTLFRTCCSWTVSTFLDSGTTTSL